MPDPTPQHPLALREPPPVTGGALAVSAASQAFLAEAQGVAPTPNRPPVIKIHHKEGKFELPSGEMVDEVAGYLLYQFRTRKWYKSAYKPGEKKPPDCYSIDLLRPAPDSVDMQGDAEGNCAGCPMNQFGTARDGRSKACGEIPWLFLYNLDFGNPPVAVVLGSPASLRALYGSRFEAGYVERMRKKHRGAYQIVWTQLRLAHHGEGVEYSSIEPHEGPALTDLDQIKALAQFHNVFRPAMEQMRGVTAEAGRPEDDGGEE